MRPGLPEGIGGGHDGDVLVHVPSDGCDEQASSVKADRRGRAEAEYGNDGDARGDDRQALLSTRTAREASVAPKADKAELGRPVDVAREGAVY